MHPIVYPNTRISAASTTDFSAEDKHPLHLLDNERVHITQCFLRQLALCRLTSRSHRILLAIFSQTIDFNKLEDDMNGTRLQQLTGLFPHHANTTVRDLAAINVLITRQGNYGHYLSINFDFSQWGQRNSSQTANNDPTILLVDDEQNIDDTLASTTDNNGHCEPLVHQETAVETPFEQQQREHQPNPNSDIAYVTQLLQQALQAIKTLTDKVNALEARIDRLVDKEILPTETETTTKNTVDSKPVANNIAAAPIKPSVEPLAELSSETASTPPVKTALRFPPQLSQHQCADAEKLLKRADDNAQLLLDMLAKRLRNTADPIKNPLSYLGGLLRRLKNNQLDIPSAPLNISPSTETQPISPDVARRAEYQDAGADCIQMERNVKMLAEQDNLTFEECLAKLELRDMWESVKSRFITAKEALTLVQESQCLTP